MASVKRLVRDFVAVVHNRAELLVVELREERLKLFGALLLAAAAVVLGLLTLVLLTFTVVLAAGEEHRVIAAAIATALYLLATALALWRLRVKLKKWSAFSATRAELRKDRAWLEGKDSST